MWTCPKCSAKVDPTFEVCWQCGTSRDGVEDPNFVRAEETPPIADARYDPIAEPDDNTAGADLVSDESPAGELVECYQALSLMEAKFLADQLSAEGIPAMSDTQDLQDALGTWQGNPKVYCRAQDLGRARAWLTAYEQRRRSEQPQGGA
jgi:hypothetical protein